VCLHLVTTISQADHSSIDALSSKANGLSSDSQWAAKQGVADLALAKKLQEKEKLLSRDSRKVYVHDVSAPWQ
jgi:hypothetical protein